MRDFPSSRGIDNKGHAVLKSLGAVAGDAESYDIFAQLACRFVWSPVSEIGQPCNSLWRVFGLGAACLY